MTLHWWMHWFWVTMLLTVLATTRENHAAPRPDGGASERQARAMYFTKTPPLAATAPDRAATAPDRDTTAPDRAPPAPDRAPPAPDRAPPAPERAPPAPDRAPPAPDRAPPGPDRAPPGPERAPHDATDVTAANVTSANTSLPEQVQWTPVATSAPRAAAADAPEPQNATFARRRNLTRPVYVAEDAGAEAAESSIVTEKPLSLETAFLQTRIPPDVESSRRARDAEGGLDAGAVAGISFAALVVAALAGSTVLVLYRRRYLNKPQTLNDKCSNPDSSGYLDDSTIRDNSEEMYSLDNDSFLNSLEAMTIQNYWTDTVKHTKL